MPHVEVNVTAWSVDPNSWSAAHSLEPQEFSSISLAFDGFSAAPQSVASDVAT